MALRNLRYEDDEILRKKSREVPEVDDKIRQLLDDMADTMYALGNGAGLAACQVGILKRLVVIDMGDGHLMKLVNPKIVGSSGVQECLEGCLSFPDRFGKTVRPQKVIVQALDENGEEQILTGDGERAKCFCHEIDHLNGIVLPDRVTEWIC
ncbi:peptide deformylase [Anaeromassilibacillus senegalensis]|uniref:peptide deformylase n=1 Tax=Anaeromassilibacillus senegalensis TaxID=1673717 RepID=UPI000681C326|nr:peptide deformylase [Anaeromassilibacillus senegalensis]